MVMLSLALPWGSPALYGAEAGPGLRMGQGWMRRAASPVLTPLSPQAQPTDMRALQDFEEPDKLHIQMNDIITVIEGRYSMGWEGRCCMAGSGTRISCQLQGCQPAWGPQERGDCEHWQSCGEQGALPLQHSAVGSLQCGGQPCPCCPPRPPPLTHPTVPCPRAAPC